MKKLFVLFMSLLIAFCGFGFKSDLFVVQKDKTDGTFVYESEKYESTHLCSYLIKHQNLIDKKDSLLINNNILIYKSINHASLFQNIYDRNRTMIAINTKDDIRYIYLDLRTNKDNLCRYLSRTT